MQRISTNLTLFYKLFIPVFWIGFAGTGTIATVAISANPVTRLVIVSIFIISLLLLYLTVFQLKRVEMDEQGAYVTNYFKHFRYPYHNIEKITQRNLGLLSVATIHLRVPGTFGKKIRFVPSRSLYADFWASHPELKQALIHS